MRTMARIRFFQTAPLKVRRYARIVIGMPAKQAASTLSVMPSPACHALRKLIQSAIANAENNNGLSADDLIVEALTVDQGPTMKRFQPVSRGRAFAILKRSSHVTVVLNTAEKILEGREAARNAKRAKRVTSKARKEARAEAIRRMQEERVAKTKRTRRAPKPATKVAAQPKAEAPKKPKTKEGGEDKKE